MPKYTAKPAIVILFLIGGLLARLPFAYSKETNPYFFPYHGCITGKVEKTRTFKQYILLNVRVEETLKGDFLPSKDITFAIKDEPTNRHLKKTSRSTTALTRIMAFALSKPLSVEADSLRLSGISEPNVVPISTLTYLSATSSNPGKAEIERLNDRLKDIPNSKKGFEDTFVKFLEKRWTIDRIKDFCRPETRRVLANPQNTYTDWEGKLHNDESLNGLEISWSAEVYDGVPLGFVIYASDKDNKMWQLEHCYESSLPNWSDDDYLKHRLSKTLENSLYAYREVHGRDRQWNKLAKLFVYDGDDKILRNPDNTVKAYSRTLANGSTLEVNLDHNRSVESITVNAKKDSLWNLVYKETTSNIEKVNKSLSDGTYGGYE